MSKKALITGITGQDGSYLAEFLLSKGYHVFGTIRPNKPPDLSRLEKVKQQVSLSDLDLCSSADIKALLEKIQPDEIYNLASQSYVSKSWEDPVQTGEVTAMSVVRILENIRLVNPKIRFYQASSSEMFGLAREVPQAETTPFYPRSPYGVAKTYGHFITVNYRESYGLFAVSGILFNHESPRRPLGYVSRKIASGVAQIRKGKLKTLSMGNIDCERDWGYAPDYVEAMWKMLQHEKPEDFVIATGVGHTVRDFLEKAFALEGMDYQKHIEIDKALWRPAEVDHIRGDASKAKRLLKWEPRTKFEELIKIMVDAEKLDS